MVDVLDVFATMDRALGARGYVLEEERYTPESFGYRSRLYRRDAKTALSLQWEARDYWFILQGGIPWRDLAIYRDVRTSTDSPDAIVRALLTDLDAAI
jgi:hypothetical protein